MTHRIGRWRRGAVLTAALVVGAGPAALLAAPAAAAAATVGYVRLAHLSPDTPPVDVYLSKIGDSSFAVQVFRSVPYGLMSKYLPVPAGTYGVAMREQGAPASAQPVLTTQVTVEAGRAYTVAGTGRFAQLGLTVLTDDLSRPAGGQAKVRVIQASVDYPVLDVARADGTPIATAVRFASTTPYQLVRPGTWTLRVRPSGSESASTLRAHLAGGSVYSLLVLDGATGLRAQLLADARGGATAPDGGVDTGAGGLAAAAGPPAGGPAGRAPVLIGAGLAVLAGLLALAVRARRLAAHRP